MATAGDHDERATAWVLCRTAARCCDSPTAESRVIPPAAVVSEGETGGG